MIYYANPSTPAIHELQARRVLGFIDTPRQGNLRPSGVLWCADNGCFGAGYPGDDRWLAWLLKHRGDVADCGFATAPDVVGDHAATWERSAPHLPAIRRLGYPAALVAQDGLTVAGCPWGEFDVLFLGGSTTWKLGPDARRLTIEARRRGIPVHMGRVNSAKRYRYAASIGCTSADGTILAMFPDTQLPTVLRWLRAHEGLWSGQRALFDVASE